MTIKLSWSILNAWARGDFETAVAYYLGKDIPPTPQMELGKIKHKIWEKFIKDNQRLPDELGGTKLVNPICEQKYQKLIPFSDEYEILLRGVIDCYDEPIIRDFKVGKTNAGYYLDSQQANIYKLFKPKAREAHYICFNPYTEERSVGVKYLTDNSVDEALNFIISNAGEMIPYLKSQKLLRHYEQRPQ